MRFAKFRGHRSFVIKVCQTGVRIERAGVQNLLCGLHDSCALGFCGLRPHKGVVDQIHRIPIIALESSCHRSHPPHVNGRSQNAEVIKRRTGKNKEKITRDDARQERKPEGLRLSFLVVRLSSGLGKSAGRPLLFGRFHSSFLYGLLVEFQYLRSTSSHRNVPLYCAWSR